MLNSLGLWVQMVAQQCQDLSWPNICHLVACCLIQEQNSHTSFFDWSGSFPSSAPKPSAAKCWDQLIVKWQMQHPLNTSLPGHKKEKVLERVFLWGLRYSNHLICFSVILNPVKSIISENSYPSIMVECRYGKIRGTNKISYLAG